MNSGKITVSNLRAAKRSRRKIVMLTAYDYITAKILDESGVDIVLVGDSLGNVFLGYDNTLPVTMEDMLVHAKAARRATGRAMLVADMPFMSYQVSPEEALFNASRFVKEAGVEGVKVEGDLYTDAMKMMIDAGIPVMGHLGFTPQAVNRTGGYRVAGRGKREAEAMLKAAKKLEKLGIFSLVLEMVPAELARRITKALSIPVIGIGAGPHCDGQVLVTQDLVGLYPKPAPKFVRHYARLGKDMKKAISTFLWDVHSGKFPGKEESF